MASSRPEAASRSLVAPVLTGRREGPVRFLEWAAPALAKGMLPGLIAGVIAGGVGSRLAMRVMAMTSVPAVQGLKTDFEATIGEITAGGTLFLLIAGAVLGMAGGVLYLAVRGILPGQGWVQGLVFGLLLLALVGRFLVDPGNPDFVILSPAGLAVGMFAALPIVYGLLFVALHRLLESRIAAVRRRAFLIVAVLLGLVPLVPAAGLGLLVIAGALLVWTLRPALGEREERALRVSASILLVGLAIWRGAVFVSGVATIL